MNDWPRGYYWNPTNSLYFYVGQYVDDYLRAIPAMQKAIEQLLIKVGGNACTIIYGGMKVGEPGTVWEPVHKFGVRDELEKCDSCNGTCHS